MLSLQSGSCVALLLTIRQSHLRGYVTLPHCGLIVLDQVWLKEKNILTGEMALEHIKVSVQICGI